MSSQEQEQTTPTASDSQPWITGEGDSDQSNVLGEPRTEDIERPGLPSEAGNPQAGISIVADDQTEAPAVPQDPAVDAALSEMHLGVQGGTNDEANWDLSPQPNNNPQLTSDDDVPSPALLSDVPGDTQVPVESSSAEMNGIELVQGVRGSEDGVSSSLESDAANQDLNLSQINDAGDEKSSLSQQNTGDAAPHEPKTIETSSTQPHVVPTVSSTGMPRLFPRSLDDPQLNVGSSGPAPPELQPESTVANAAENQQTTQEGPVFSMTLTALSPSSGMPWRRRIAVLAFSAVVNLGFPMINGAMAGLGEIFARSIVAPFVIDSFHSRWPGLKPARTEDRQQGRPAQIRDTSAR